MTATKETETAREAFVMAFNDVFLVISIALFVCTGAIWFCKSPVTEQRHASAG